ncbi:MAG TPA: helix-turn-helix transcriptional regulator [Candidatus Sulfomarinibacteraceae bacterium]|nr:helix-turn-helix transcriptional regulator [Candidatus Sulfomarinibacteraceae bacterium]
MATTSAERRAKRTADDLHRNLATDVGRFRSDAGIKPAELARASGVDPGFLSRIERGDERPTLETYARLAAALGADLSVRLYPNTGPAIRDRHQARILETLLAIMHPRWQPYPEIAVRRPSRGWIDVGLHDRHGKVMVATEIQSELRRLEQVIRWSTEKAASLLSWEGWPQLGESPEVSQLLIVRDTRATRDVAREFRRTLDAAYPAHPDDALAALIGGDRWPGPALLWASGDGRQPRPFRIVARR